MLLEVEPRLLDVDPREDDVEDRRVVEVRRLDDVVLPPATVLLVVLEPPAAWASLRPATATIFCRSVGVASLVGPA